MGNAPNLDSLVKFSVFERPLNSSTMGLDLDNGNKLQASACSLYTSTCTLSRQVNIKHMHVQCNQAKEQTLQSVSGCSHLTSSNPFGSISFDDLHPRIQLIKKPFICMSGCSFIFGTTMYLTSAQVK